MKTIGLIGGMSWESSAEYYRLINELVRHRMGGLNSAKVLMYSVNQEEISKLEREGKWDEILEQMVGISLRLERGGVDFILICCNLVHIVAEHIQKRIAVPLVHIADATAEAIKASGIFSVGILGVKDVMEGEFFAGRIAKAGIKVLVPDEDGKRALDSIIFDELAFGKIVEDSRKRVKQLIQDFKKNGAQGVVLACTELPMLIQERESELPLFDTLKLHAEKAVRLSMEG